MSIQDCHLIDLPKIPDERGNLSFIEGAKHIPFEIKRIYYLYDIPAGAERGGHAHKELQQLIVALSGSLDIILDDGSNKKTYTLNKPYQGLYIAPLIWRELFNFSQHSVCFVLASDYYMESDYFRSYKEFSQFVCR